MGLSGMSGCCDSGCEIQVDSSAQKKTLWLVLLINVLMFFVLIFGSFLGKTVSLFADSFDNLGDAITYAVSIWAVGKGSLQKARVSLFKGLLIITGALAVAVNFSIKWFTHEIPIAELMGGLSVAALIANLICLGLLWRHRNDDINMESVWHCSRNDIVTNSSVILAAFLVWHFNSWVPDMVLGGILFFYLMRSGVIITLKSLKQMKELSE